MNLSQDNVVDVLLCADQLNLEDLLEAATDFVRRNIGKLAKTSAWNEMMKINPKLIINLFSNIMFLK